MNILEGIDEILEKLARSLDNQKAAFQELKTLQNRSQEHILELMIRGEMSEGLFAALVRLRDGAVLASACCESEELRRGAWDVRDCKNEKCCF